MEELLGVVLEFAMECLPELLLGLVWDDASNQKQNGLGLI